MLYSLMESSILKNYRFDIFHNQGLTWNNLVFNLISRY